MYLYVILETYDKGKEIERFTEEKWNEVKPRLNPLRIVYVTSDLSDEKLKDFDRIIWDRLYNPLTRIYEKIVIPFTSDYEKNCKAAETETNRKLMIIEERAEQLRINRDIRIKRKRAENLENGNYERLNQIQNEMDQLIPMETEEIEAFSIWKTTGYKRPAGRRIEGIKEDYNMSWKDFINFIDTKLFSA